MNPAGVVADLKWYGKGKGYMLLAKQLRDGQLEFWEIRCIIDLMDLLLWPQIQLSQCGWLHEVAHLSKAFASSIGSKINTRLCMITEGLLNCKMLTDYYCQ